MNDDIGLTQEPAMNDLDFAPAATAPDCGTLPTPTESRGRAVAASLG